MLAAKMHFGTTVRLGAIACLAALPLMAEPADNADPVRLRVEVYSRGSSLVHVQSNSGWLGFDSENWASENWLQVHVEKGRWRVGTAVSEEIMGLDLVYSYTPLRLDYILWEHPLWYAWRLHCMIPELTLHLSTYWWNSTGYSYMKVPIAGRLDVVAGLDMLGLGLSVSAGVIGAYTSTNRTTRHWDTYSGLSPNIEVRLRALTFGADLTRPDKP
jgi:hypothetical protein